MTPGGDFVVATPFRSVCDNNARALEEIGRLRFIALGTRRGTAGVSAAHTRLAPWFGLVTYASEYVLSPYRAESLRYTLHPVFDLWVKQRLAPGDHMISSYGHTNACFKWVRRHGGKTFLDAGNSHPDNFWTLLAEEYARWNCRIPPISPFHHKRSKRMLEEVDYVLCPSSFVRDSFVERGFRPEQMLKNVYPVDLSCFQPAASARPANRPLTIINTGMISLRKGAPYMLEAFRLIYQRHPSTRFLLTRIIHDSAQPILAKYSDLPIEWSPPLPHAQLAERLRSADLFMLLSLEEGLVRTAIEAMACGLPVILTPNTGANDLVQPGINGEVVPIRDARAAADAALKWAEWQHQGKSIDNSTVANRLSFATFKADFLQQLGAIGC